MLTDYHVHLRPDGDEHAGRGVLHRGQRRALPGDGRGARDRRARRLRARPPLLPGARDLAPPLVGRERRRRRRRLLRVRRARRPTCGSGSRWTSCPAARTGSPTSSTAREWDYVIGSVHFLREESIDHPGWDVWADPSARPERVWQRYFETMAEAARSGLYDVLAHPDLVKVWGRERPWPEGDLRRFYEPLAEAVADTGVTIEVSTAGLRKPVGELYPADDLLAMLLDAGATVALSSDAHVPGDVGAGYERALELLDRHGVDRPRGLRAPRAAPRADRRRVASGHGRGRDRLRRATASPRGGGSCSAASRSSTSSGSRATPTPTCWPTRSSTRCSAPPRWATSASTSPTPTSATRTPTRSTSCAPRSRSCAATSARSATSTRPS